MYINTTSLEALTSSLSNLLNITEDDLLNELNQCWIASTKDRGACNLDVLDREIEKFILRHPPPSNNRRNSHVSFITTFTSCSRQFL